MLEEFGKGVWESIGIGVLIFVMFSVFAALKTAGHSEELNKTLDSVQGSVTSSFDIWQSAKDAAEFVTILAAGIGILLYALHKLDIIDWFSSPRY